METVIIQRPTFSSQIYNADVEPRQSIRLYGECQDRCRYIKQVDANGVTTYHQESYAQPFDLTFRVGDRAVYGSYNLTYTGKIVAIGPKTVTIDAHGTGERQHRLSLYDFAWRNWDYNAEKIAHDNSVEMECI